MYISDKESPLRVTWVTQILNPNKHVEKCNISKLSKDTDSLPLEAGDCCELDLRRSLFEWF